MTMNQEMVHRAATLVCAATMLVALGLGAWWWGSARRMDRVQFDNGWIVEGCDGKIAIGRMRAPASPPDVTRILVQSTSRAPGATRAAWPAFGMWRPNRDIAAFVLPVWTILTLFAAPSVLWLLFGPRYVRVPPIKSRSRRSASPVDALARAAESSRRAA